MQRACQVRLRADRPGVNLISGVRPFDRLLGGPGAITNAIGFAKSYSWSHHAAARVYDDAGNVIETHE